MANPTCLSRPESTPVQPGSDDLESHIRALRRYARTLTASPDDADDLVQETLKRALTYLGDEREIRNLRSYLLTMLHHVRVDLAKRRGRDGEPIAIGSGLPLASGPGQSDHLVCNEAVEAIKRLPEEQRAVILLVGLEEFAYQEVADVLQIPIGTVMSRLSRGRKNLRKILGLGDLAVDLVSTQLEGGRALRQASARRCPLSSDAA